MMGRRSLRPSVQALDETQQMPWRVKRRLRRQQRRGATGIILFADIRETSRSLVHKAGVVALWKDGVELCSGSGLRKRVKFVKLSPGSHHIEFKVIRQRESRSSSFERVIRL